MILGAGGHAKVVADAARLAGWEVIGFIDELHPDRTDSAFFGAPLLTSQSLEALPSGSSAAIGIGDCQARLAGARRLLARGFLLPAIVHPRATTAGSAILRDACQLMAGAIVNPDAQLGTAVIVNTGATVDHDCRIADGVHLAPGVHLAGNVSVGESTLVGIGSVVKPGVHIGRHCTVGAGSVVIRDVPDGTTVCGVPAKPLRS